MKLIGNALLLLALGLSNSLAQAQTAPPAAPLRALIISGGPSLDYNQYAIESNARYLEKLTAKARWQRVFFADGKLHSRTISALQPTPRFRAERALAWITDDEMPDEPVGVQASALTRVDGPSTKIAVNGALAAFVKPGAGERGLLYFTGHGSAGQTTNWLGKTAPDYENTTYALWGDGDYSTRELARAVKSWPAKNPLVVVMVQCHSGGFANVLFEGGDPKKPFVDRDIAGFFASTGERAAAGCTNEVNERDYQDFTTHFFAALSGLSRDGRRTTGADYDRNGAVSMSEAFAWANVHDLSIDVPVSTSDAYLRAVTPRQNEEWPKTPYSQVLANAQPWQKAMLNELSQILGLKGETRIADAMKAYAALQNRDEREPDLSGVDEAALGARVERLQAQLKRRFPGLKSAKNSSSYRVAKRQAIAYLMARPAEVAALDAALDAYERAYGAADVREAMLERFVRGANTVLLQSQLRDKGTPQQRAIFTKLRMAEGRNPLL